MSDGREIVPTRALVKEGTKGIGGIAGGAALLILRALTGTILGPIFGGILTIGGIGVAAASKEDRVAGGVVAGVGALTVLSSFVGFGSTLLLVGGLGLLGVGGFSLYKFIKGLRSRR